MCLLLHSQLFSLRLSVLMATLNKRGNLNYLLSDMIRVVAKIGLIKFLLPQMLD